MRGGTGRGWDEWFALLDEWGATGRRHGEIAAWLAAEHGVDSWWTQTITVGYEQERGLRAPGGGRDGLFGASASRTVAASVDRVFAAFVDPELRRQWLLDAVLHERGSQPGRSVRFDFGDGATRVLVGLAPKGPGKSQVAVQHERLPDARSAEERKAYWRERLTALKILLEG